MPDYREILELAKIYKKRATDFFCLSPGHDPYYMVNNPFAMAKGEWFADLYQQYWHTLVDPMVRSLHYAILSHDVYLPGEKQVRYINRDPYYEKLLDSAKVARYLGLVPMDIVEETKNEPDVFIPEPMPPPDLDFNPVAWLNPVEIEDFPRKPHYTLTDFPFNQRYHLEIWCEKSYSPLKDLARKYGAVFQQGQGEQTLVCAHMLMERRKQYNRPVRIFYVSDFDPAGSSMPLAVARKLEFMLEAIRAKNDEPDVRLYPLALTQEQVEAYHLPRTPLKDKEGRKDSWEAIHGVDAVELNALEAQPQYKGELIRIVEEAMLNYYDADLERRAQLAKQIYVEQLAGVQQEIYGRYPQVKRLQAEYDQIVYTIAPKLQRLNEEIKDLWRNMSRDLEIDMPDIADYLVKHPLPEANKAAELPTPLYDSNRDYFSQLAVYKKHQGKRIVF